MLINNKVSKIVSGLIISTSFLFSGCSMHNPFGVGYDSSVCSDSKSFGVCGSPADIYKYRDKIKKVQADYLKARLDTTLYFAVNPSGIVQVKSDRNGKWERYDISKWKQIIDSRIKEKDQKVAAEEELSKKLNNLHTAHGFSNLVKSDLPVTKGGDLSIQYKKQGSLLVTRTRIGNIIRDQGLIQQVFVANYVDTEGDLISSHDLFVVVKNPDWVVGEKTPKNVSLNSFPTPVSADLIKKQQRIDQYQENTVNSYNFDSAQGYSAAKQIPDIKKNKNDNDIINQFLSK